MGEYQALPHTGKNNVGTISKHLKQFSTYLKDSRMNSGNDFSTKVEAMKKFLVELSEEVFFSAVPNAQNAKLFALKNQFNIILPIYESIISLNETMFAQIANRDDCSVVLEKLNEIYLEHENIHKDICALYELFKEFEIEEIRAQQNLGDAKVEYSEKSEENKVNYNYDTLVVASGNNEISQKLLDDSNDSHADSSNKRSLTSSSVKNWIWVLLILVIINLLAFLILS